MKAQGTVQTIGIVAVLIVIAWIFFGLVFPAMCKAGITALCGI